MFGHGAIQGGGQRGRESHAAHEETGETAGAAGTDEAEDCGGDGGTAALQQMCEQGFRAARTTTSLAFQML